MIKTIIFDFDGVIVDSLEVKTNAFAEMYKPFGEEVVKKVVKYHLENGGVSRFEKFKLYHKNFLGIEVAENEIKGMVKDFSTLVLDKVIKAPYVLGAKEFIEANYDKYMMFISSGTPEFELKEICIRRGINEKFKGIYGSPSKKSTHVKKILSDWKLNSDEVLFIGDSLSDYEAAEQNDLHFLPVGNTLKSIDKFIDSTVENLIGLENLI